VTLSRLKRGYRQVGAGSARVRRRRRAATTSRRRKGGSSISCPRDAVFVPACPLVRKSHENAVPFY